MNGNYDREYIDNKLQKTYFYSKKEVEEILSNIKEGTSDIEIDYLFKAMDLFKNINSDNYANIDPLNEIDNILKYYKHPEIYIIKAHIQSFKGVSNNIIKEVSTKKEFINLARTWKVYGEIEKSNLLEGRLRIDSKFETSKESAIDKLKRALVLDPENSKTKCSLASCYKFNSSYGKTSNEDLLEAKKLIESILVNSKNNIEIKKTCIIYSDILYEFGVNSVNNKDKFYFYSLALNEIDKAINIDFKEDSSAHMKKCQIINELCTIKIEEKDYEEAVKFAELARIEAINHRPTKSKEKISEDSYYRRLLYAYVHLIKVYTELNDREKVNYYYGNLYINYKIFKNLLLSEKNENIKDYLFKKYRIELDVDDESFKDQGIIREIYQSKEGTTIILLSLNKDNNDKIILRKKRLSKADYDKFNFAKENKQVVEYYLYTNEVKNIKSPRKIRLTDKTVDVEIKDLDMRQILNGVIYKVIKTHGDRWIMYVEEEESKIHYKMHCYNILESEIPYETLLDDYQNQNYYIKFREGIKVGYYITGTEGKIYLKK
ncbi:hypothetical protein [Clostridium sp.]|uniref:hypothetical protein n=1 Tax=Clostridium sp. TaxID=1506 RepID=UPI003F3D57A3